MDAVKMIESLIRTFMCLAGILGNNWLAIRSLPRQKSGLRTNEVLFFNLAVSNLITNYLVDLPDTMADFAERWILGETYCGMFLFFADLSETSSIYTTFFISVFWHQKLVGSLKRGGAPVQLDSLCLVGCLLAGSWTVAVAFSIPHFFFVKVEGANESYGCVDVYPNALARQTYEVFYLTLANALPVAGIVFASCQIVITLLQSQRRIHGHNTKPSNGNKSTENKDDERPGTSKDFNNSASLTNICTAVPAPSCPNSFPINRAAKADSRAGAPPKLSQSRRTPAKPSSNSSTQVRAAKSVVAVASVFLVCWMTHLLLRISNNIHTSSIVVEVASYIAASYTSVIPYIFLHGVKKLSCSCKR
ncbi:C-X-C chemokine receptor type 4 [Anabas testudineus]|uniref:C-X-C chemokine receptor type 4 n=1 Tax=Anabas testudineus TaxID=64144 RepID=UPI000E465DFF|nr:C-X-C chemokine receptor type 4 [Anabas testudineus]